MPPNYHRVPCCYNCVHQDLHWSICKKHGNGGSNDGTCDDHVPDTRPESAEREQEWEGQ
jgi:hypothetical protein